MTDLHRQPPEVDPLAFLCGGGEMGRLTREFDWSRTPVGPAAGWPQSLKTIVRTMLDSRYAMWLGWGPDFTFFYNDAYARMTLGPKHPGALGKPARVVWSEVWPDIGPRAESVLRTGKATWDEGLLLFLERRGFKEETYHTFSYSPVPDDQGAVGGMLCVVTEDTERTIGERRLRTLRELAARTTDEAKSVEEACQTSARLLAGNPKDVPFALLYLLDAEGRRATLAGAAGVEPDRPISPAAVVLSDSALPWPFRTVADSGKGVVVQNLAARYGAFPGGAWPEPSQQAVVLPMAKPGQTQLAGFVIVGISPRRPLDDGYRGFLDLLAGQVATAVANARAYEDERRRAEALADLDRAKTAFFSNVSHEFRTPLTLVLGPVEDALAEIDGPLPPGLHERLEVVHRNGVRLQRLVNTLLDFSRLEAGRVEATYEPTDLAAFTTDLASNFRSACERAGLALEVDCPPLSEPVFVDRGMWEKVVLNLLSNAFKFTFDGGITVSLGRRGDSVELRVRDTGTGIPAEEMPRLFERFHRIENARGRTHEGSGIGLALVLELVKLHGGSIAAESVFERGTTFVVTVPLGSAHLPRERVGTRQTVAVATPGAGPFVEEALRWLPAGQGHGAFGPEIPPDQEPVSVPLATPTEAEADRSRVLVADDNADMRRYIVRLLAGRYDVEPVADGAAALAAVRRHVPDLIVSDVMMPRLDGFGLLRELRADPRTAGVPVILLSARAGEESRVEGMQAGADDYLVKPFSTRELLARVAAILQINRLRRESEQAIRQSEERFHSFMNNSPATAFIKDDEGRFVFVNRTVEQQFARPLSEWVGKTDEQLFPSDEARLIRQNDLSVLASGRSAQFEEASTQPDGLHHYLSFKFPLQDRDGRWLLGGMSVDITDRKRAEAALRQSEERLAAELEATTRLHALSSRLLSADDLTAALKDVLENAIVTCGADFGSIQLLNPQAGALEIVAQQGFRDEYVSSFQSVRLNDGTACARAMQSGERVIIEDVELDPAFEPHRRAAAAAGFRAVQTTPLRTHDGAIVGALSTHFRRPHRVSERDERLLDLYARHAADLIERLRFEQALKDADRRKDEFLATLAHELRNPLAPLGNGLQVMKLARGDAEATEEARAMMERQLGQMVRLIDDLLDLSRISRGKIVLRKERVELARVVQQAVETSRPLIEQAGHDLSINVPPSPIYVDADVTRLAQVFSNLLNNAAKYTERGGRVHLNVQRGGNEAVISVRDNGIGIPPQMLPRVFEMFTQIDRNLERSEGGLGIGLSIVQRLVEMHDGSVEARSDGHRMGSEFVVRLPVVLSVVEPLGGHDQPSRPSNRRRILVVDDNRDSATSLAMLLKLLGNETRTAHDGLEALDVAAAFRPDLIFLDIGMPRLNGYDTARRIRTQPWGRDTTLIALTGWGQEDDRRQSREAGFDSHITKPVDPDVLEKVLAAFQSETA
jgi:PAS domain S-box-containing protein